MIDVPLNDEVAARYHQWVSQDGVTLDDPTFADLVGDIADHVVRAVACGAGREARFPARRGAGVTGETCQKACSTLHELWKQRIRWGSPTSAEMLTTCPLWTTLPLMAWSAT